MFKLCGFDIWIIQPSMELKLFELVSLSIWLCHYSNQISAVAQIASIFMITDYSILCAIPIFFRKSWSGSYTVTEILCSFCAVHTFILSCLAPKQAELWGITWTETTESEMRTLKDQLKEGKDDSSTLIYQ